MNVPITLAGVPCTQAAMRLMGKTIKITSPEGNGYGEIDTVYNNGDGDRADVTITIAEGLRNE